MTKKALAFGLIAVASFTTAWWLSHKRKPTHQFSQWTTVLVTNTSPNRIELSFPGMIVKGDPFMKPYWFVMIGVNSYPGVRTNVYIMQYETP